MSDSAFQSAFFHHFLEAAPYVVRMRSQHCVIWLDPALPTSARAELAEEIAILRLLGAHVTVVVGEEPDPRGQGVDATKADALHHRNGDLERRWKTLLSRGWVGVPDRSFRVSVASGNFCSGRRIGIVNGQDYGYLGRLRSIDVERIDALQREGFILLQGGSIDGMTGLSLVVSALRLAVDLAVQARADKLILVTEQLPDGATLPTEWSPTELDRQIQQQPSPLLDAVDKALQGGVERVHLINGVQPGGVLAELLSRRGSGILVAAAGSAEIETAKPDEVSELVALISRFEPDGDLLPRSRTLIEAGVGDFQVLKVDGRIVGCGALRMSPEGGFCLLESIAIHPEFQRQKLGVLLLKSLLRQAVNRGAEVVYVLTTGAEDWFKGFGFVAESRDTVPEFVAAAVHPERGSTVLRRRVEKLERMPD